MSSFTLQINSVEDARRAVHLYQQTGFDFRIPLVQAVLDGRIAHFETRRSGCARRLKVFLALTARRPTLILIGDDDDCPTGPDGWPVARRLLRWASFIVLHGTGAERWHYETTINTAELCGRVLMVETSSAMLPAWSAATRRWAPETGVQILKVSEGLPPHPVSMAPEVIQ